MNFKDLIPLAFLVSCAFKTPENTIATNAASFILYPKEIPILHLNFENQITKMTTSFSLEQIDQNISLTTSNSPSDEKSPLREYLLRESFKNLQNETTEHKFDERFLYLQKIPSFNYLELISARALTSDFLKEGLRMSPSGSNLSFSYTISTDLTEDFSKFTEISLKAYTLVRGKLTFLGNGISYYKNGTPSEISPQTLEITQPMTLKLDSIPSKIIQSIITNDNDIFLTVDDFKVHKPNQPTTSFLSMSSDILKTKSRVIVSTDTETKTFYASSNQSLQAFLSSQYGLCVLDTKKNFLKIGSLPSEIFISDLNNIPSEDYPKRFWISLNEQRSLPEDTMEPGKTYSLVYASPNEILHSQKQRLTIISNKNLRHDSSLAKLSLGKVRNGDTLEISFSGLNSTQIKSPTTLQGKYSRNECFSCELLERSCRPSNDGGPDCFEDKTEGHSINDCKMLSSRQGGDEHNGAFYTCFQESSTPFTCSYQANTILTSAFSPLPYDLEGNSYRIFLIVEDKEISIKDADSFALLKSSQSNTLKQGSFKITISNLETNDFYDAHIEVRPELNLEQTEFSFQTNCPSDASLPPDLLVGLYPLQNIQEFNISVDAIRFQ